MLSSICFFWHFFSLSTADTYVIYGTAFVFYTNSKISEDFLGKDVFYERFFIIQNWRTEFLIFDKDLSAVAYKSRLNVPKVMLADFAMQEVSVPF